MTGSRTSVPTWPNIDYIKMQDVSEENEGVVTNTYDQVLRGDVVLKVLDDDSVARRSR